MRNVRFGLTFYLRVCAFGRITFLNSEMIGMDHVGPIFVNFDLKS